MENVNLNLDSQTLEQCLKTVSNFGNSKLINICNGQINIIPWGTVDWLVAIILIIIGLGVCGIILGVVFCILDNF